MVLSPRSGRQIQFDGTLSARFAGSYYSPSVTLGLTPRALCFHLLRRFKGETRSKN
jgi:hypothetical protein